MRTPLAALSLVLVGGLAALAPPLDPATAATTSYSVGDAASCKTFLDAVGGTGDSTTNAHICFVSSATLPADSTLYVVDGYTLRPDGTGDSPNFVNNGDVVVQSSGQSGFDGFFNSGSFQNNNVLAIQGGSTNTGRITNEPGGTLYVDTGYELANKGTLENQALVRISGLLTQTGTFSNLLNVRLTCTGIIDGTFSGPAAKGQCPLSSSGAAASPTTSRLNAPVTLTATFVGQSQPGLAPSGTVAFTSPGVTLGSACAAAPLKDVGNTTAVATCRTTALHVGEHAVRAAYLGDSHYVPGSATTASITTNPPTPGFHVMAMSHGRVRVRVTTTPPDPTSKIRVSLVVNGKKMLLGKAAADAGGVSVYRGTISGRARLVRLYVTLRGTGYVVDQVLPITTMS